MVFVLHVFPISDNNIHAIRNGIYYIEHIKIADIPVSPSYICKLANSTSFLAMVNRYDVTRDVGDT